MKTASYPVRARSVVVLYRVYRRPPWTGRVNLSMLNIPYLLWLLPVLESCIGDLDKTPRRLRTGAGVKLLGRDNLHGTPATMTSDPHTPEPPQNAAPSEAALRFLQFSARLLLEYNVRSKALERRIERIAQHVGVNVQTVVGYREVTLAVADGRDLRARAPELRINVAVSAGALHVIDELCLNRIGLDEATKSLEALERLAPRHGRWLVAVLFGLAASAIAWLLRADLGAIAVSGVSSALGLIVRQELARQSVMLFAQPFAAGLIGAALGGLAVRQGWTETPGFCLIVPALMLVPGPHLINGVHDMLENHMQTGLCRLALAMSILIATALGVALGGWLTLGPATLSTAPSEAIRMTLPLDAALAGVAACGFGAFYNAPWRVLWVSIVCGVVGHGLRYVSLDHLSVEISTLFACLAIGLIAERGRWSPAPAVLGRRVRWRRTDDARSLHLPEHCRRHALVSRRNGGRSGAGRGNSGALLQVRVRGRRHRGRPPDRCPAGEPGPPSRSPLPVVATFGPLTAGRLTAGLAGSRSCRPSAPRSSPDT